jgi:chromate reductase, NAD(P)H dehydrogenase (quinone)
LRVLVISGWVGARSRHDALERAARRAASPGTEISRFDGVERLPHFNPDLDVDPLPAPIAALRAQIAAADALALCSPEHVHSFPGSLKNALDWLVSAIEPIGKPVPLITASPSGAASAHAYLREVLRTMMGTYLIDGGAHALSWSQLDGDIASPGLLAALVDGFAQLNAVCETICTS